MSDPLNPEPNEVGGGGAESMPAPEAPPGPVGPETPGMPDEPTPLGGPPTEPMNAIDLGDALSGSRYSGYQAAW